MPRITQEEFNSYLEQIKDNEIIKLDLQENEIEDAGARWLAEALKDNSSLSSLTLINNNIIEVGAWALAEALRVNSTLTSLDISWNHIGEGGARWLAKALKENTGLSFLNLYYNNIGEGGAKMLAVALHENNNLTSLNLFNNKIGKEGASLLAEALKFNSSLTFLDLGNNTIGVEGAKLLAEALKKNINLTSLDLAMNNIGDVGVRSLAEALQTNKCVSYYEGEKTRELKNLVDKNKDDNLNLVRLIDSEFNSYLNTVANKQIFCPSEELNLENLKQRCAAINYILQTEEQIKPNPEVILFFNIAVKKLQRSDSYNSVTEFFESTIYELAMELNEGYYKSVYQYPGLYIKNRLSRNEPYEISDNVKDKLLSLPAVIFYNVAIDFFKQGNNEEALEKIDEAQNQVPAQPRIMLEKVKILYSLGYSFPEEFSRALSAPVTKTDKFTEMRDWLEEKGELNKAIALQEKLIKDTGDNPGLAKLALLQLKNHCSSEALESLDKLVQHEPEEFSAYQMKARLHYIHGDGKFEEAINTGERRAKPSCEEYYKLVDWLDKFSDEVRSRKYCDKAKELSDKAILTEIYTNWFDQHGGKQEDILTLLAEIAHIKSKTVKYAEELREFEIITFNYAEETVMENEQVSIIGESNEIN